MSSYGPLASAAASRPLRCCEALLLCLLFALFVGVRDLPLVDLPQHALALHEWRGIDAHDPAFASLELNFRTPYLLAYPLARALCAVVSELMALKLTLALAIALQAVTLRKLCEHLGHDPWLGLLGIPLGLGYSCCFGFVAFCAALPLVYLTFSLVLAHREAATLKSGLLLAVTLSLLLLAHGVALAFTVVVVAPLLPGGAGRLWQRALPLLSPLVLGLLWLAPGHTSTRLGGDLWGLDAQRLLEIPGQLVGIGAADPASTALGLLLLVALGVSLGRPRPWVFTLPLALALCGYALFPSMFRGAGPLHPRFAVCFVPAALVAFSPTRVQSPRRRTARRALLLAVTLAVPALWCLRLPRYEQDVRDFRALIAPLPRDLRVRPLVFERSSSAFPGTPALLHVPAYYALEKGGSAGYSFAMYSISVVRFRPGVRILMGGGAEWAPQQFDAEREADDYDYFIVRSSADLGSLLFPGPTPRAVLERHVGDWWGYRAAHRSARRQR